jgi:hypothetical protein
LTGIYAVNRTLDERGVLGTRATDDDARRTAQPGDGEGQNRTGDTTIFSRVLYQLSYLARGAEG